MMANSIFYRNYIILFLIMLNLTEDSATRSTTTPEIIMTTDLGDISFDLLNHNSTAPILQPCQAYLQMFAESASNFTECLILNARPFRFCESCVVHYTKARGVYRDLFERKDKECHDALLKADRIQVLTLVYNNMLNVWSNADCENCFETIVEGEDGDVNFTLTNDTILFHNYFKNVSVCLNVTPGSIIDTEHQWNSSDCIKCKKSYSALNSHYEKIVKETSYHVCMDIIDMMNYTRLMWGKMLNCSHRQGDEAPVLGIAFVMGMVPVIFYTANRIFGAKHEKSIVVQKRLKKPSSVPDYGSNYSRNSTQHVTFSTSTSSN
ncbi:hypothetical protein LOTGIDRAFT_166554 [Lottia gigantea]|uniref:Osteopetrosis-associated transmembrane protein 1 n=1 Tax=Lottia gigantea TaxID=225164 RepID=V4A2A8_LOTGI|nr:hypothetical protein LOTGIDRAFT_166554 [Lottia gigantea]ESO87406.1 hypothetical protein LOTGIDRAFT_166554 [Lottia gigantea]